MTTPTLGSGPTHPRPSTPPAPPRPARTQTPPRQNFVAAIGADGAGFTLPKPPTFQIGSGRLPGARWL
jgi:hypothetical protein